MKSKAEGERLKAEVGLSKKALLHEIDILSVLALLNMKWERMARERGSFEDGMYRGALNAHQSTAGRLAALLGIATDVSSFLLHSQVREQKEAA